MRKITSLIMLFSMSAFFANPVLALEASSLSTDNVKSIDKLIAKYQERAERPKSCPLESKRYADILTKLDNVKNVFKNNCTQNNNSKLNDVLDSFKDIESELQKREIITKSQTVESQINQAVSGDAKNDTVNGVKFSTLFSNINTMIKKKQCNLEDGRVLEMTAGLIYDSTQFGLISGSNIGVIVAASGFVISSALKLIDLIIQQRFDFEKVADRQTFIKLNCSFYDIRNTLEAEGVLDVDTIAVRDDLRDANAYLEMITQDLKKIDEEKSKMPETYSLIDSNSIKEQAGNLALVKKTLLSLKELITYSKYDGMNLPEETKKMLAITEISKKSEMVLTQLEYYKTLNISSIPMLDDVFVQSLSRFNMTDFNNLNALLKMPAAELTNTVRPEMLFHIVRIVSDIESKEAAIIEKNSNVKKDLALINDKSKAELTSRQVKLEAIKMRLSKIVSPKSFSALDDGSDNTIGIIEDYKAISSLIYGEWGDKFLKYSTLKSADEINNFNEKLNAFYKRYGDQFNMLTVDKQAGTYMCQDAQRARVSFKYADSLAQEGYDFIITNKDLFYGEGKNYYNQNLNEQDNNGFLSSVERIQRHYLSTILAVKKMKGEAIDPSDEEKYLNKRGFANNQYLGRTMLDIEASRKQIKLLQERFEMKNCQRSLKEDLN